MTTTTMLRSHLALNRLVWTYLPQGQPCGFITGYEDETAGFVVEHIVRWSGSLRAMLRAALEEAWARRFEYVVLMVPAQHVAQPALILLALRMGFREYERTDEAAWFVRYRAWTP